MEDYDGYVRLAFAIVTQAVKDYKKEAKRLMKNHSNKEAYDEILKLESFFRSEWCDFLLQGKMTGEYILSKLNKEYGDGLYYKEKNRVSEPSGKTETKNRTHVRKSRRI
jgi:glycyl-tRNA synthetase alpha subunit